MPMNEVSGHPRRHGNKTVQIQKQYRMPRKREHLHPEDIEIYALEREIVELQRSAKAERDAAVRYRAMGFPEYTNRNDDKADMYDRRIEELQEQIRQLRHEAVLEGVED